MPSSQDKIAKWRRRVEEYSLAADRTASEDELLASTYRQLAKSYQALILHEERMNPPGGR